MGRRPRKIVELVDQQVAHALNDNERATKALELAQMCGEIDKLRADAADAASTERKKIRALEKRRRLLAECVRTGNEMRSAQEELFGTPLPKSAPPPRSENAPAFTAPAEARPPCGMCGHAEHASFPGRACGSEMVGGHFCVCGLRAAAPAPTAAATLVPSAADFASPFDDEADDFAARPGTSDGYVGAQLSAPARGRGKSKGTNGTAK